MVQIQPNITNEETSKVDCQTTLMNYAASNPRKINTLEKNKILREINNEPITNLITQHSNDAWADIFLTIYLYGITDKKIILDIIKTYIQGCNLKWNYKTKLA